jgi:protein phosphatase
LSTLQVNAYGQSAVGNVRADNQDAIRSFAPENETTLQTHGYLYAIADGLGGYEHGGIASTTALEAFFNTFYAGHPAKPSNNMRQGVQAANLAVYQTAQRLGARMGTTLTAINLVGNQLHLAHIGDCRVYLIRGRKSTCLTNDHTAVGELVRLRVLSVDKVRTHERRSVLEKCLGMQLFIQPDINQYTLQQDDYVILCSDGIWAHVQDAEFGEIALDIRDPEMISQTLMDLALSRESDDNVSATVIHIQQVAEPAAAASSSWGLTHLIRSKFMGRA